MTEKSRFIEGYNPKSGGSKSPETIERGYQPSGSKNNSPPQSGYSPINTGNNPTNTTGGTPPGKK